MIISAVPFNFDDILKTFNSFHSRLEFAMENGGERINFLDFTTIKNNNILEFNWYHKLSFSGRYLNYLSFQFLRKRAQ